MTLCKLNDAACVKVTLPAPTVRDTLCHANATFISAHTCNISRHKTLDILLASGIIVFTALWAAPPQRSDAQTIARRSQAPQPASARRTQPAATAGHRRAVCQRGFLRSPRLGSSQVRDAAPRAGRRPADQRSGRQVRIFPAVVLSGAIGFPGQWFVRPGTSQTWPQGGSQADCRGDGIYSADSTARSGSGKRGVGEPSQRAFRPRRSSANHRARAGPSSKKTPHPAMIRRLLLHEMNSRLIMSNSGKTLRPYARDTRTLQAWLCFSGTE